MSDTFKDQLKAIVTEYEAVSGSLNRYERANLEMRCVAAVERTSGLSSTYSNNVKKGNLTTNVGIAKALLLDIENGYLETLEELAHGNIFSDFLEMADYLVGKEYKDAAAVMAGSTLEVHLKNLCTKHGIATTSNGRPKKAGSMNEELKKAGVYTKLNQKQVTAWLDLRNHAAHGKYEEYTKEQVQLLVGGVRDFIIRYPA